MNHLSAADYLVVASYLAIVAVAGLWRPNPRNAEDFLLAGKGMGWMPIGISIAAAFISGISFLGLPAEVMANGLGFVIYSLSYILVIPVITRLFLPFYASLRITTAYEYLEQRFNRRVRLYCSGMFVSWRLLWIGTVIYVPSLLVATVTGVPLLGAVLTIGILTTVYTAFGGLRAVIVTDFIQFFVMAGGAAVAILVAASAIPGGISGVLEIGAAHGRTSFANFSLDPAERLTVWGALIGGFFANLTFFGADQMVIQRYLSTRSASEMQKTFLLNCVALLLIVGLLAMLGLALFAFYHSRPAAAGSIPPDRILPHFIATEFPPGLRGLLAAAIFAASMSTLSAGVNAVAGAIFNDFGGGRQSNGTDVALLRWLSIATGGACTLLACFIGRLGSIIEIAVRAVDGFAGPLLGVFLAGMLTKRIGSNAILGGGVLGTIATTFVNFFSPLSFVWYAAFGCAATLAASALIQFFGGASAQVNNAALRDAD